ncbi:hypothetical protein CDAR_559241 [Caerostris darwini]|uniref:Uncharacterized protein n=1 Tax=Caerostris darwini TaxID=1538125 RepID=A0AAV4P1V1_9ARAC|nr:hypothetical protein CDAR_559241 [Caerostris darwini]
MFSRRPNKAEADLPEARKGDTKEIQPATTSAFWRQKSTTLRNCTHTTSIKHRAPIAEPQIRIIIKRPLQQWLLQAYLLRTKGEGGKKEQLPPSRTVSVLCHFPGVRQKEHGGPTNSDEAISKAWPFTMLPSAICKIKKNKAVLKILCKQAIP